MNETGDRIYGNNNANVLAEAMDVVKYFPIPGGIIRRIVVWVNAVDEVHFRVRNGETLCLVGESGCGISMLGRSMLRLQQPSSRSVPCCNGSLLRERPKIYQRLP